MFVPVVDKKRNPLMPTTPRKGKEVGEVGESHTVFSEWRILCKVECRTLWHPNPRDSRWD